MLWRILFSRKYRVSKRFRFEVGVDWLREKFSEWWLLILSIVLLAIGLPLVLGFRLIEPESARWTLSALVQAGAALIGIFFIALSLLWNQATRDREKLIGLLEGYMRIFWVTKSRDTKFGTIETETVKELRTNMSGMCIKDVTSPVLNQVADIRPLIGDCCWSLLALECASSLYRPGGLPLDELIDNMEVAMWNLKIKPEQRDKISRIAHKLFLSEIAFFNYLLDFHNKVSNLERKAKLDSKISAFFTEHMFRARRVDRVGMSLYRLRFFGSFVGNGLKIVSLMWLLCLTIGLLLLVSLDRIPNHILPFLTSATVAIGIVALGMTLSLVFRAVRSSD